MREREANHFKMEGDRTKRELEKLKEDISNLKHHCDNLESERQSFLQRLSEMHPQPMRVFKESTFFIFLLAYCIQYMIY